MANTEVDNTVLAFNTIAEIDWQAATADEADAEEVFEIDPPSADEKLLIMIYNGASYQGSITGAVAAGDLWAAPSSDLSLTIEQGKEKCIVLEGGKYKGDGVILLTLTPADGKKLKTDHAAKVAAVILP